MRQITFQKTLETTTVAQAALGEQAITADGRGWVYVKANEAISLAMASTRIANTSVATTISSATDGDGLITKITKASAGWTVGQFADAYGLIDLGTGQGQFFKIRTNTADTLVLYREYALGTALSADSTMVLVRPYLAEKSAVTTLNQVPTGVAQVAFASGDYGWHLTRGPGVIIAGSAVVVANEQVTPGDDTEGYVIGIANGETPDDVSTYGRTLVANQTADKVALIDTLLY